MSSFLSLNWKDLIKGFIVAVIGALITAIYGAIEAGGISWTWAFWEPIVYTSVGAGLAYLIKNWLTNSEDKFITSEKKSKAGTQTKMDI